MHHHYIDRFSQGNSHVHRLDGRAKLLAVLAYSGVLISFGRYDVLAMAPMSIMPLAMLWAGGVPAWFAIRRVLILSPFIAMLCLASPLYDRSAQPTCLGVAISGGWLTAANVAIKFAMTMLALTAMMCTTPFALLLEAMRKLGMPMLLTVQLGFLYRYIFVLIDQSMRIRRARDFRGAAESPVGRRLAAVGGIVGSLFIRTLERSERVHVAMCARGYRGEQHSLSRLRFTTTDAAFLAGVTMYLVICRWVYPIFLLG